MLEQEAPIILKFYDLMLWTMNHTARFPRHHRYYWFARIECDSEKAPATGHFSLSRLFNYARTNRYPGVHAQPDLAPLAGLFFERSEYSPRIHSGECARPHHAHQSRSRDLPELARASAHIVGLYAFHRCVGRPGRMMFALPSNVIADPRNVALGKAQHAISFTPTEARPEYPRCIDGSRVWNATAKKPIRPGIFLYRISFTYARTILSWLVAPFTFPMNSDSNSVGGPPINM